MNYFKLGVMLGTIATICELDMAGKSKLFEKIQTASRKLKIQKAASIADIRQYLEAEVDGLTEEARFRLLTILDGDEQQAAGHVAVQPL